MDITSRDITPRVLIWCAVSSKPQATEDKSSLAVQEQEGRAYAERVGGSVVDVLTVPGHSRDLWRWQDAEDQMPAYRRLREYCESGAFDILFTWDADRLGRDPALSAQALSLVKRAGASIYVHTGGYTVGEKSESASYIFSIDTVRAGQEQKRRVKRHHFGMVNRIRRGLHPGRWPYAYCAIRDAAGECVGAELVPAEAEVVRAITQLYLDGLGYQAIANKLDERGYSAPAGGEWHESSVSRIIQRDIYAGYIEWGNARNAEPSDKFPALWDADTHKAIMRERHRRRRQAGGSDIATFLSGIVYCNECGHPMSHSPTTADGVVYSYYRCQRYRRAQPCKPNNVPLADLIDAFEAWLDTIAEVGIDAALKAGAPRETSTLRAERDTLEKARAEAEAGLDRLAAAIASGTIRPSTASATEARLLEQIEAYDVRLEQIDEEIAALPNPEEQRAHLEQILQSGVGRLDDARKHKLNRALRNLGVKILCEAGDIKAIVY